MSRATGADGLIEPRDFGRVAVVMGGWAAEREVSLMSGRPMLAALCEAGVDAHGIDAGRDVVDVLQQGGFDRALLILHGRGGEDGHLQGALELAGIPYTGSGVLASALCMDKLRSKALCGVHGIPSARAEAVDSVGAAHAALVRLGLPVVVKPVLEGSSVGVSIVRDTGALEAAWHKAAGHGPVMMETWLPGSEITCGILHRQCLPLVRIQPAAEFYDYEAKYLSSETGYTCPADLPSATAMRIEELALQAFDALGCRGWARVDFMLDAAGEACFMECNTAPGMTDHSLMPTAAAAAGMDYRALCLAILSTSLRAGEVD